MCHTCWRWNEKRFRIDWFIWLNRHDRPRLKERELRKSSRVARQMRQGMLINRTKVPHWSVASQSGSDLFVQRWFTQLAPCWHVLENPQSQVAFVEAAQAVGVSLRLRQFCDIQYVSVRIDTYSMYIHTCNILHLSNCTCHNKVNCLVAFLGVTFLSRTRIPGTSSSARVSGLFASPVCQLQLLQRCHHRPALQPKSRFQGSRVPALRSVGKRRGTTPRPRDWNPTVTAVGNIHFWSISGSRRSGARLEGLHFHYTGLGTETRAGSSMVFHGFPV